jgi:hypothetical protein
MVVSMLAKCKERRKQLQDAFDKMIDYSDTATLDKLNDEMIKVEVMIIRLEKQAFNKQYENQKELIMC